MIKYKAIIQHFTLHSNKIDSITIKKKNPFIRHGEQFQKEINNKYKVQQEDLLLNRNYIH